MIATTHENVSFDVDTFMFVSNDGELLDQDQCDELNLDARYFYVEHKDAIDAELDELEAPAHTSEANTHVATHCTGCETEVLLVTTLGFCQTCRDACYHDHPIEASTLVGDDIA